MFNELKGYKKIYEYDLFIGDSNYLHKGIGTKVIEIVNNYIYDNYQADCIVLRPFKRNQIAIRAYEKNQFHNVKEYNGKDTLGNNEKMILLINTKEK